MLLFIYSAYGQNNLLKESIYFETAKYDLTAESKSTLDNLLDSLEKFQTYKIFIKGNTDNVGDSAYNKALSELRINSTVDYFTNHDISKSVFTTAAFGEEQPIVANVSDHGKQRNRRVDISISFIRKVPVDSSQFLPSIWELYKQTEIESQQFCINSTRDTVLRCDKGTLVYVKANSFKIPSTCKTNCLTIKVKEDFLKSEMILDNLSTTSNGQLIETQGMVYTEANDCKGNKLNLLKGKDLIVFVPTDTIVPETQIFQGNRTPHDSIMNWTVSNTSVLGNYTINELNICANWICGGVLPKSVRYSDVRSNCVRCNFFICRIRRIGFAFKGIWAKPTHYENVKFRKCQRQLRKDRRMESKQKSFQPFSETALLNERRYLAPELVPKCESLEELYQKYGVANLAALLEAINKPLMDSLGVSTIQELQDTMTKMSNNNFELSYLNKSISYDDFKYYVYNTSRLGWSNIDVFADVRKDSLVNMKINLKFARNIDCKLVFIDRQFVIAANNMEGKYTFEDLPKGEKVCIVALKLDEGKPSLSIQETTTGNKTYNIDFKVMTLEELKKELGKLDR